MKGAQICQLMNKVKEKAKLLNVTQPQKKKTKTKSRREC